MSVGDRIKELRESKKLKQSDLAKIIGVTPSAIGNYENGVSHPKVDILYKIIEALGCDANYLFQDDIIVEPKTLSYREELHIDKYRQLDEHGKKLVDIVADIEYDRCKSKNNSIIPLPQYSKILYDFPVSAGTGEYLDNSTATIVHLDIEPPHGTDYILRISGDSMEPQYHDGDYIYVHSTESINYGEIGIFVYAGNVYMKEYTQSGLRSLNPNYSIIPGNGEIRCLGKVLGVVEGAIDK